MYFWQMFSASVNRYFGLLVLISFYTASWFTRVSWVFSIARTKPHQSPAYRSLVAFGCLLMLLWVGNLGPIIDSCSRHKAWATEYPYLCLPSTSVTVFAFTIPFSPILLSHWLLSSCIGISSSLGPSGDWF
ncbi:hypothetical protein CPB83DRAFT_232493 [Crepidotus variabilis]|uniref:Uncharacterized protein n=1 Tax=Crepidotus variabilis TaxID=179855 RepID=A0A9P6EUM2_9AGAR|nr:hypothetical protein CPB83DRAFT_232493 [Crepidotus variabilis]